MIDKEIMLRLGTAFVEAVRHRIKFSLNISNLSHLSKGSQFSDRDVTKGLKLAGGIHGPSLEYAVRAWQLGTGYSGELSYIIAHLSRFIKIDCQARIYLSVIKICNYHMFCILHQEDFFHTQYAQIQDDQIIGNFYLLNKIFPANTIIVDPWINKATLIKYLGSAHRAFIKKYGVEKHYDAKLYTTGVSFEVGTEDNKSNLSFSAVKEMIHCFEHYYFTKLPQKKISENYGKSLAAMQKKLSLYIALEKFKILLEKISSSYSKETNSPENNTQIFYFEKSLRYIERCLATEGYLRALPLQNLIFAVLRVTILIKKTNPPAFLDASTLIMAQPGEIMMDTLASDNFYSYDEMKNLGTHQIRHIICRNTNATSKRYWELCNYLHEENITCFQKNIDYSQISLPHTLDRNMINPYSHNQTYLREYNPREHPLAHLYSSKYHHYCYQQLEYALTAQPKAGLVDGSPNFGW